MGIDDPRIHISAVNIRSGLAIPRYPADDTIMASSTDVVRAYFAACEAQDISAVERLFDPGFVSRAADGTSFGIVGQRERLAEFFGEFAGIDLEIHTMLETGDRVATHYTHRATLRRSGERVAWDRIVIHRVIADRIIEAVGVSDSKRLAAAPERAGASPPTCRDRSFSFPPLAEPYETALRQAIASIVERFPTVTAIAACGTIVRGVPNRSSDLDLYVIHAEPWYQRLQCFFNGVPAEIFVNPEFQVRRFLASQADDGRPIVAHMLATGYAVFDPDGVLSRLRGEAERVLEAGPPPPHDRVRPKYMMASIYEDATDVVESDPRSARYFANRVVWEAVQEAFRRAGSFIPRPKEILSRLAEVDPALHRLAVAFVDESDHRRAVETAGLILDRVVGVRGFFEWESAPTQAEPP